MDQIFIDFQKHNCSKVGTESTAILSVTVFSCCLSVIGTLFIMYTYIRLSGIRDDTRRLLMFLSLADLITAGGILMIPLSHLNYTPPVPGQRVHEKHITNVCKAQSFVTTFSSMASFFWTFVIALQITSDWLSNLNSVQRRFVFGISHLICWGVPAVICGLALNADVLGFNLESTGPWCWIRGDISNNRKIVWMLIAGKGWEFLCYFACANLYILFKIHACFQRRRHRRLQNVTSYDALNDNAINQSNNFRHRQSLLYLLMALYLLRVWGTSRFVLNVLTGHLRWEISCTVHYTLLILQSYGDSGQGFWNFVIFICLDKTVRLRQLICCHGNNQEEGSNMRKCCCCYGRLRSESLYSVNERQRLVREMVESCS